MLLYSITDVAEKLGVTIHTLRYYERMGLCPKAQRKRNGHRIYSELDVARISLVLILREVGLPLDAIAEYIKLLDAPDRQRQEKARLITAYKQQVDKKIRFLQSVSELLTDKLGYYEQDKPDSSDLEHTRQALDHRFT